MYTAWLLGCPSQWTPKFLTGRRALISAAAMSVKAPGMARAAHLRDMVVHDDHEPRLGEGLNGAVEHLPDGACQRPGVVMSEPVHRGRCQDLAGSEGRWLVPPQDRLYRVGQPHAIEAHVGDELRQLVHGARGQPLGHERLQVARPVDAHQPDLVPVLVHDPAARGLQGQLAGLHPSAAEGGDRHGQGPGQDQPPHGRHQPRPPASAHISFPRQA